MSSEIFSSPSSGDSTVVNVRSQTLPTGRRSGYWSTLQDLVMDMPSSRQYNFMIAETAMEHRVPLNLDLLESNPEFTEPSDVKQQSLQSARSNIQVFRNIAKRQADREEMENHSRLARIASAWLGHDESIEAIEQAQEVIGQVKMHPQRMSTKMEIVREELKAIQQARRKVTIFHLWAAEFTMTSRRLWRQFKELFTRNRIWESSIKELEGKQGAHVSTYFSFLRWAFWLNLFVGLVFLLFVTIPFAAVWGFDEKEKVLVPTYDESFTDTQKFIGIFTGGASLNYSAYFIGSYLYRYKGNEPTEEGGYHASLAYLVAGGMTVFTIFIVIFRGVYNAAFQAALRHGEGQHVLSEIVFGGYDHSLTDPHSIRIKQRNLLQLLRQKLDEERSCEEYNQRPKLPLYMRRLGINLVIFTILALALFAVKQSVDRYSDGSDVERLIPPVILVILNVFLPIVFERLAALELWRTELFVIQLSVARAIVLRLVGLYVFFFVQFQRREEFMCWETYIGQQAYNLFIIVFVSELLTSLFLDMLLSWLHRHFKFVQSGPAFQTVDYLLELIYSQAILWFGIFFTPLLGLLAVVKCVVLFYCKKWATLRFCQPPKRAFYARHSLRGLMFGLLLLTMLLVSLPLGYIITQLPTSGAQMPTEWQDRFIPAGALSGPTCTANLVTCTQCLSNSRVDTEDVCWRTDGFSASNPGNYPTGVQVKLGAFCATCPSGCGPFRNQNSMYETLTKEIKTWPRGLQNLLHWIGSLAFAAMALFVLVYVCGPIAIGEETDEC